MSTPSASAQKLPLPDWAQARRFDEHIPLDVNGDDVADYVVSIKGQPGCGKDILSPDLITVYDHKGKRVHDVDVQFTASDQEITTTVVYDPDGPDGPQQAQTLLNEHLLAAIYNTSQRYLSFEPDERAPGGSNPRCIPCLPGLDYDNQAHFAKLSPDQSTAYDEIEQQVQNLVQENSGQPLDLLILNNHGTDNIIQYDGRDGSQHRLNASTVLSRVIPYMSPDARLVFLSCEVAEGNRFENFAVQITHNGEYKDIMIFVFETPAASEKDTGGHYDQMLLSYVRNADRTRSDINSLRVISKGENILIPCEYTLKGKSGIKGVYTSKTILAPFEELKARAQAEN